MVATPNGDPGTRVFPVAVWDAMANRMLVWGGADADLWSLDFNVPVPEWKKLATMNPPAPRAGPAFGWDKEARKIWIFGGGDLNTGDALEDMAVLDVATLSWSSPQITGNGPDARYWTGFAWDSVEKSLVVHGGFDGFGDLTDAFVLNTAAGTWTALPFTNRPSWRYGHVGYSGAGKTYYFGGFDDFDFISYDELYSLTLTGAPAWSEETATGPVARAFAAGTTRADGSLLLFGGYDYDTGADFSDVWSYKAGAWSQIATTYPATAGRSAAAVVSRE